MIFSHVLYQLSYLGIRVEPLGPERARSLTVVTIAVHLFGVGWRSGNAIAFAKPFQKIAILAAAAAERGVLGALRLTAQRAFLLVRRLSHSRRRWGDWRRRAS